MRTHKHQTYSMMAFDDNNNYKQPKKTMSNMSHFNFNLCTTLFFIVLFTIPVLFLLHTPTTTSICTTLATSTNANPSSWSGDLRNTQYAWNRLHFAIGKPQTTLRIAVFSRKWPVGAAPGGMERHAYTLHTALALRGHQVHVFTSPLPEGIDLKTVSGDQDSSNDNDHDHDNTGRRRSISPRIHCHEGEPGRWRYNKAWEQFVEEDQHQPFDVIHTESVALPHWLAKDLPNLVASWHGIAMEALHSDIYQDLALRHEPEHMSPDFIKSMEGVIPKVINEIRFFNKYAHHVAISDSCGEVLRDIYQIPNRRVHVILNGVDEDSFQIDLKEGQDFKSSMGIPSNATVFGVAGRLVKDKGHPLLFEAFKKIMKMHGNAFLVVAGSGPWENRYKELGSRVIVLGSMVPSKLRAFYNSIDVFVNPTLRPQGLDLTLMEAMMSGKPVMASRFPSIKGTIVVEDEFGFMFSPNVDSLLESLDEAIKEGPRRLAQRGRACRDYATSMFSATKMALAYERLFLCIKNETYCSYP